MQHSFSQESKELFEKQVMQVINACNISFPEIGLDLNDDVLRQERRYNGKKYYDGDLRVPVEKVMNVPLKREFPCLVNVKLRKPVIRFTTR